MFLTKPMQRLISDFVFNPADVIKMDFFDYQPDPYFSSTRLILTGPPYGDRKKDPNSTKIAQRFGAKAAEIAQYASFITLGSWLKNPYPWNTATS